MHYSATSAILNELGLAYTPVACARVREKPRDIDSLSQPAVSSCALWRAAEHKLFFASAEDHAGCAVGAYVMGFELSEETQHELTGALTLMSEVGYLPASEVAEIPQISQAGAGTVYGPLADFPFAADCAIVWVNPAQAMLLGEALRTTHWKSAQAESTALFGRPACGAVARAINTQQEALSLGCTGMRTFTEIAPALTLFVIPGAALASLPNDLRQVLTSNEKMLAHYQTKKNAHT